MYKVMQRLRFEAFLETLSEVERIDAIDFILSMADCFPTEQFHDYAESPFFQNFCNKYKQFVIESSSKSRTFSFWSMYIKMMGMSCVGFFIGEMIIVFIS